MAQGLELKSASPITMGPVGSVSQLQDRWRYLAKRLAGLSQDGHDEPVLAQAKWCLYCAGYHSGSSHGSSHDPDPTASRLDPSADPATTTAWSTAISLDAQNSIRRNLIEAENLLDDFSNQQPASIDAVVHDFNGDGDVEVRLANSQLIAWLAPAAGGQLFGLDVRAGGRNVLASGQPSFLEYFWYPQIQSGEVEDYLKRAERRFTLNSYHGQIRQGHGRVQVLLQQQAMVYDLPLRVSKALTMLENSNEVEVTYLIEGLPEGLLLNFGSVWHWDGIGSDSTNQYVHDLAGRRLGSGRRSWYWPQSFGFGLCDVWSGVDLQLKAPDGCRLVVSPAARCGASNESGNYLAVMPHWIIAGDADGRWSTKFNLRVDPAPIDVRNSST